MPKLIPIIPGLPTDRIVRRNGDRPSGLSVFARFAATDKPSSAGRDTPPTNAFAPAEEAGPPNYNATPRDKRLDLYAYSFWRGPSGAQSAFAPAAQYGGSQSGFIATWDPLGSGRHGVALMLRGYATPNGDERELAFGLRWQPRRSIPLSLSAERRIVGGGEDRFAAYLSGGVSDVRLPAGVRLDGFGQAGLLFGNTDDRFFDGQVRLKHKLADVGGAQLHLGGGVWAGGQKGVARLDAGPTIAVSLAHFDLRLDWRQRVAGNALPANGVALTASTSF